MHGWSETISSYDSSRAIIAFRRHLFPGGVAMARQCTIGKISPRYFEGLLSTVPSRVWRHCSFEVLTPLRTPYVAELPTSSVKVVAQASCALFLVACVSIGVMTSMGISGLEPTHVFALTHAINTMYAPASTPPQSRVTDVSRVAFRRGKVRLRYRLPCCY